MNRVEELLERLRAQTATPADLAELKQWLATPEGRAKARERLWMESALHSVFRAVPVLAVLAKKSAPQTLPGTMVAWVSAPFRKNWTRWAIAAAAMILGIVGWWQWQASWSAGATLSFAAEGGAGESILITRAGRTWHPAGPLTIGVGDTIEVAAGSPGAELQLDGAQTRMALQPGAKFRVLSLLPQKRFALDRGTLHAEVAHQPEGQPMLIQTPTAEARVLGTVFTLAARTDGTGLTVDLGLVRLSQTDGSAQDVKSGQAALAKPGTPVRRVPYLLNEPPATDRIPQPWIKNKGLHTIPVGGTVTFDFATKPKWTLGHGAYWQPPLASTPGHLCLTGIGPDDPAYKAVSPYVSVGPDEVISVTGRARYFQGARLGLQYYLCDESPNCFGNLNVESSATSDVPEFVPFRIEFTLPSYADLRFISIVLKCSHADGKQPQEGDTILVEELQIHRGP